MEQRWSVMPVKYEEFKGHPMIALLKDEDDEYPFKFGVGKAKLILENIDAIKEFVEENDNEY